MGVVVVPLLSALSRCIRRRDLGEQFWHDRAAAPPTGCEFDRADVACCGIHGQLHLLPLPPTRRAMLAGKPFTIGTEAGSFAVYQQIERLAGLPIRDLHRDPRKAEARARIVRHCRRRPGQLDHAREKDDSLAERQAEQRIQCQGCLDGAVREDFGMAAPVALPARHLVAGSNQTEREPRHLREA